MKAHVKNIIGGTALGLALLAPAIPLWAGFGGFHPVNIFSGNNVGAAGSLQSARYSSDNSQHIGCVVAEATAYSYVRCTAQDINGTWMTCKTADPKYIAVAHAMTSHSAITFSMPYGSSTCGFIQVINGSPYLR